jgi:hypothetical protein
VGGDDTATGLPATGVEAIDGLTVTADLADLAAAAAPGGASRGVAARYGGVG